MVERMQAIGQRIAKALRRLKRSDESGQAYLETLVIIPVLLLLFVAAAYLGRVYYAKIAAEEAAYDCTRAAIASLSAGPQGDRLGGRQQGVKAARRALSGFHLDPDNASIRVFARETWGRGQAVQCDVGYRVDLSGIPFLHWIEADPYLPVWAKGVGRLEEFKSQW